MAEAVGSSITRWLPALQLVRAYSWTEALDLMRGDREPPVFIVTDLQLPGSQPTQTLQELRQWHPRVPVLALTMLDDAATHQLCELHSAHYLCKTAAAELLRQALQNCLGPDNWARWSTQQGPRAQPLLDLTARQLDVLRELANGLSNREIADKRNISEDTVRSHVKALFARLGVKNRTQASKCYLQHKDDLRATGT